MFKKVFYPIIISTVLFCVISFLSVIFSLLSRKGTENPTVNIGLPLNYYEQFWMDKNDLHHGWNSKNFVIDFILVLIIVLAAYFIQNIKKSQV